jgi:hypothetical protein
MRALVFAVFLLIVSGCDSALGATRTAGDFDRPVPPNEPRAELSLVLDLEPTQDCEERFDLALYQDRGVDLVRWDKGGSRCIGRNVTIVYLSAKLDKEALLAQVRKLALEVKTP